MVDDHPTKPCLKSHDGSITGERLGETLFEKFHHISTGELGFVVFIEPSREALFSVDTPNRSSIVAMTHRMETSELL